MRYLVILTIIASGILVVGFIVTQSAPAEQLSFSGTLDRTDPTFEESGEYYDTYEIRIKEGQFVDFNLKSEDFDTYLFIVTPSGEEINVDDYYTGDTNAGLLFVSRESGIYTIYVTSSVKGETGDYEFTCDTNQTTLEKAYKGELAEGDEVSWKGGEYYDRYDVELGPNEKRILALDSDDFAAYLTIHQPDGFVDYVYGYPAAEVIEADENGGTFTLIVTSEYAKEAGSYQLEIRSLVDVPATDEAESDEP